MIFGCQNLVFCFSNYIQEFCLSMFAPLFFVFLTFMFVTSRVHGVINFKYLLLYVLENAESCFWAWGSIFKWINVTMIKDQIDKFHYILIIIGKSRVVMPICTSCHGPKVVLEKNWYYIMLIRAWDANMWLVQFLAWVRQCRRCTNQHSVEHIIPEFLCCETTSYRAN